MPWRLKPLENELRAIAIGHNLADSIAAQQVTRLADDRVRVERRLPCANDIEHRTPVLVVADRNRKGVMASTARVLPDVFHPRLRRPLAHALSHARTDRFRIKQCALSGSELSQHFGAIGVRVVLLHSLQVVSRKRRVHFLCRSAPDQDARIVPPEVPLVEVIQRAALTVWATEESRACRQ